MLLAIENSIASLTDVLGIVTILLIFFAAVGMHLFMSLHYNRCMQTDTGFFQDPDVNHMFYKELEWVRL